MWNKLHEVISSDEKVQNSSTKGESRSIFRFSVRRLYATDVAREYSKIG